MCYSTCRDIVIQLVEVGGADAGLRDEFGRYPADLAKEMNHPDVMNYLYQKMAK